MPTYEYRCPRGHEFEKFYRKISDAGAEVPCPQCGLIAERMLSAGAGLVFKGSGFYITDYGKDGKKDHPAAARSTTGGEGSNESPSSSGDGAGGGDAKATSDAKSETKPASAESKPAVTKESAKKDSPKSDAASAKPTKPTKPSTE